MKTMAVFLCFLLASLDLSRSVLFFSGLSSTRARARLLSNTWGTFPSRYWPGVEISPSAGRAASLNCESGWDSWGEMPGCAAAFQV